MPNEETTYRAFVTNKLESIEAQTIKTNGSVAAAKLEIAELKQWRSYILGGLTILSILVVPILLYVVIHSLYRI